jgi:hypothetical protein
VILRGTLLSLLVYIVPLVAIIIVLNAVRFFDDMSLIFTSMAGNMWCGMNPSLILASVALLVFASVAIAYGLKTGSKIPCKKAYEYRRKYEINSKSLFIIMGAFLVLGSLPMVYDLLGDIKAAIVSSGGLLASVMAILNSQKKDQGKIPLGFLAPVALTLLVYGVLLLAFIAAIHFSSLDHEIKWVGLAVVFLSYWLSKKVNINHISIHRYYRDRLMELFMPNAEKLFNKEHTGEAALANEAKLSDMCQFTESSSEAENKIVGPYHIINTNMVTMDSSYMKLRARGGDNFILSPLYCGNAVTGWRDTEEYMGGDMSLATAMAISGAAADPHGAPGGEGLTKNWSISLLMALFNVRLGYWAMNPNPKRNSCSFDFPNWFIQGKRELTGNGMDEKSDFVHLADGGHFENLAAYELIRRKVRMIVICDGAADPGFTFIDFANLVEKIRVDFGVEIEVQGHQNFQINNEQAKSLLSMCPKPNEHHPHGVALADSGFVTATINYGEGIEPGTLIYIKTTIVGGLSDDIYSYKRGHDTFPDETTADQFFDERQFEAYRELGYRIGLTLGENDEVNKIFKEESGKEGQK